MKYFPKLTWQNNHLFISDAKYMLKDWEKSLCMDFQPKPYINIKLYKYMYMYYNSNAKWMKVLSLLSSFGLGHFQEGQSQISKIPGP